MIVPISVVCPTHKGNKKLPKLINSILNNTVKPDEIIICGTNINDIKNLNHKKIKFIVSPISNQSYQRKLAIKKSKNKLILQCDDDIVLEKTFFQKMYNHFKGDIDVKKIVSASILTRNNYHQSVRWNRLYNNNIIFKKLIYFLNNFKNVKYMSIISSGRIAPRLPKNFSNKSGKNEILEGNEWLCSTICYNKKYYKNYYDINNAEKSYFEDVIFTHTLFKKNFNLVLDPNIIAYHPYKKKSDLKLFLKTIPVQYKIVRIFNKSIILFLIDIIIFLMIFSFAK